MVSDSFTSIEHLYELYLKHSQITTDSRNIPENCIFFGIKGPRFDGNAYAEEALKKGAAYVVIDNADFNKGPQYLVCSDTIKTLQDMATMHRKHLKIPVICISGSNGKTTTKELMQRVLKQKFNAFATAGNLNNHIGLPLSILSIHKEHQIAILELGANHAGEIALLSEIAAPDYGLITNIGKDHLEGFGSLEGVISANNELFEYLAKHNGKVFVNADDNVVSKMAGQFQFEIITYGQNNQNYFCSGRVKELFPFIEIELNNSENFSIIKTKLFGSFHLYNVLAAAGIGRYFGISDGQITEAVESYRPDNNRSQMIKTGSNTIILDAYNANPSSVELMLKDFAKLDAPNKLVILGDMFELGDDSEKEHNAIVSLLKSLNFKFAALCGEYFYKAGQGSDYETFKTTDDLKKWFIDLKPENHFVMIKGSRGMKLEEIL